MSGRAVACVVLTIRTLTSILERTGGRGGCCPHQGRTRNEYVASTLQPCSFRPPFETLTSTACPSRQYIHVHTCTTHEYYGHCMVHCFLRYSPTVPSHTAYFSVRKFPANSLAQKTPNKTQKFIRVKHTKYLPFPNNKAQEIITKPK